MPAREFSGFDVDTIADAVRQPPMRELRATARSRRRRRATLSSAALALAVMAGIVAPVVTGPDRLGSPDRPTPSGPVLPGRPGDFTLTGPESGVDVRIDGCVLRFARTTDGGRTWSGWDAARYEATRCEPGSAQAGESLDYSVLGDRIYLVDDDGSRRLSTDEGRTWQDADQAITSVRAFPDSARPVFCHFGCRAVDEPLAVDPSTSRVYRLSTTPPTPLPLFSLYPASDGSIWTTYGSGRVGSRSVDRGATWSTWTSPPEAGSLALVGVDGQVGYRVATGLRGKVTLERTADGGKTWSATSVELPDGRHCDLTVGADGALLVVVQTGPESDRRAEVRVSRDGGRTSTVARDGGLPVGSVSVAPGYAWLFEGGTGPAEEADRLVLTNDGRDWRQFLLATS
ncbi:WD40/YVTN/BNR-like repeat-containing protein [Micromonospora marina]|uniref:WD40/YVTN/BNR-like repeat-containing protein n=1 Tax=Micromonospora marina TaxID=307120 RepID=UPI003D75E2DD